MAIQDETNYSLKGKQVKDIASRITANHDAIGDIGGELASKQDALSETQLNAVNSGIDSTKVGQIATNTTNIGTNTGDIATINGKIPAQASSSNQLADKAFVTDAVQTNSAHFRGNWATWDDVPTDPIEYPIDDDGNHTPTSNDYMVVQDASGFPTSPDPALEGTWRFKYSGVWNTNGKDGWHPEYQVNETPLTSDQLAALNSGITAEAVTKLGGIEAGAEVNDIDSISVNGTAVTPDANKNVALTIPDGIIELTTDDYNYPDTGTKDSIALWLLDEGIYRLGADLRIRGDHSGTGSWTDGNKGSLIIIESSGGSSPRKTAVYINSVGAVVNLSNVPANNYFAYDKTLLAGSLVIDNLTTTSSSLPLSANMGKYLNDNKADKTAFTGTDGTSAGTMGLVPAPATTDAGKVLSASGAWTGLPEGIKTLTTADYDYPSDNPTAVATWKLEKGIYLKPAGILARRYAGSSSSSLMTTDNDVIIIAGGATYSSGDKHYAEYIVFGDRVGAPDYRVVDYNSGSSQSLANFAYNNTSQLLTSDRVVNHLSTTSEGRVLDARQGKVLKDLIDSLVIKNAGAPTTSTVGTVGMLLEDTTNGKLYQCTAVTPGTAPDPDTYTWTEVGGSSVNVVQTLGTSTTNVMSQDATRDMIYAMTDGTKRGICIGASAEVGSGVAFKENATAIGVYAKAKKDYDVAVGYNAQCSAGYGYDVAIGANATTNGTFMSGAVALGAYSRATQQGEFNIGTSVTDYGYNNSNYRLLTGLYDGQSAHDAATKGQLDTAISTAKSLSGNSAPSTSTTGEVGQMYVNTTTGDIYYLASITEESGQPDTYNWEQLTTGTVNNATISVTNNGTAVDSFTANQATNKTIALAYPEITMTSTDPGEGASLAANHFIAVY